MTKGLSDFLNLPTLEEALKAQQELEQDTVPTEPAPGPEAPAEADISTSLEKFSAMQAKMALLEGTEHTAAMDDLYKEILGHARDLMEYGFNIDSPRARGIFEVASAMYNHAMSAANSKRDAQLKAMRLALDRRKIDLEEKRTNHVIGQQTATIGEDNTILVEDRNELLRKMRELQKPDGAASVPPA